MTVLQLLDQFEDQDWDDDTVLGLLQQFIEERAAEKDTTILDDLSIFLKVTAGMLCPKCHEPMDTCCGSGNPRCEICEGPCPGCSDGPGPGEDTEEDDEDDEDN